jgi:ribulose-5-phosphate 4-epimerase/fuculose-1-phosphate aldolase
MPRQRPAYPNRLPHLQEVDVDSNEVLAQKLSTAWRFLYGRGFVDGFGHISVRAVEPDHFIVTPHSLDRHADASEMAIVDLDGNVVGEPVRLPAELPIHLEIYRQRPDVASVAHLHFLYTTSFSMTDVDLGISYFLASIFRSGIPIHPDPKLVNDRARGEALATSLGPHRAVIMKAHGVAVTGGSVEEMVAGAFLLEENARRTWVSATMGEPEFLDPELMAEVENEMLSSGGPIRRVWQLCESEAAAGGER